MTKITNPLSDNLKQKIGQDGTDYYIEYDNQSANPVVSPYDGTVVFSRETDQGYVVKIVHEIRGVKFESKFLNLSTVYVSTGQKVDQGQRIGMTSNRRLKYFLKNKDTNKSENPKDWFNVQFVGSLGDGVEKKSELTKEPETKTDGKVSSLRSKLFPDGKKEIPSLKSRKPVSPFALPFGMVKMGIEGMLQDAEKENQKREEKKKQKETEKQKKKEEKDNDLSPDIQFENFDKEIVKEEINRIKQLMK